MSHVTPENGPEVAAEPHVVAARRLGMLLQILLLGQLLVLALGGLYAVGAGARVFRYAGF